MSKEAVKPVDPNRFRLTRREFTKALFILPFVPSVTATIMEGCIEKGEYKKIEAMNPQTEVEKKTYEVLKVYDQIQKAGNLTPERASTLTQAAISTTKKEKLTENNVIFSSNNSTNKENNSSLNENKDQNNSSKTPDIYRTLNDFDFFKVKTNGDEDAAAVLTVAAEAAKPGVDLKNEVAQNYDIVKQDSGLSGEAANVATVAAFTDKDISRTIETYRKTKEKFDKEIVPIVATETLITGNQAKSEASLENIKKQTDSKSDQSAMLYAATFTTAKMEEITTAHERLEELEIAEEAKGNLLVAGLLNNDVNAVVEMYNFAGDLEGMTDLAASEIALVTVSENLPEFDGQGKIIPQYPQHMPHSSCGGFYNWFFFHNYNSRYGGSTFRGSTDYESGIHGRGGIRGGGKLGGGS